MENDSCSASQAEVFQMTVWQSRGDCAMLANQPLPLSFPRFKGRREGYGREDGFSGNPGSTKTTRSRSSTTVPGGAPLGFLTYFFSVIATCTIFAFFILL